MLVEKLGSPKGIQGEMDHMKSAVNFQAHSVADITFQPASLDIWSAKYRLCAKDGTVIDHKIDDTFKRVARALADVEAESLREAFQSVCVI